MECGGSGGLGGTVFNGGTLRSTNTTALGTGGLEMNRGAPDPVSALAIDSLTWTVSSTRS